MSPILIRENDWIEKMWVSFVPTGRTSLTLDFSLFALRFSLFGFNRRRFACAIELTDLHIFQTHLCNRSSSHTTCSSCSCSSCSQLRTQTRLQRLHFVHQRRVIAITATNVSESFKHELSHRSVNQRGHITASTAAASTAALTTRTPTAIAPIAAIAAATSTPTPTTAATATTITITVITVTIAVTVTDIATTAVDGRRRSELCRRGKRKVKQCVASMFLQHGHMRVGCPHLQVSLIFAYNKSTSLTRPTFKMQETAIRLLRLFLHFQWALRFTRAAHATSCCSAKTTK